MSDLLTILGSELLCKKYIFNLKSDVFKPIRSFQYFGGLEKHKQNSKIQQTFKNDKSDFRSFMNRHDVVSSQTWVRFAGYCHYYVLNSFAKHISPTLDMLYFGQ